MTSQPLLKDLQRYVTPHFAVHWKVIGAQLDISTSALGIIENDKMHQAVQCCNSMLQQWLDKDTAASWGKLIEVLESPAISCASDNCDHKSM